MWRRSSGPPSDRHLSQVGAKGSTDPLITTATATGRRPSSPVVTRRGRLPRSRLGLPEQFGHALERSVPTRAVAGTPR